MTVWTDRGIDRTGGKSGSNVDTSRHIWVWVGALLAALLAIPASLPLAAPGVPETYDLPFHVARVIELKETLASGNPFPRWVQPFVAGLGFPFFNFYPPLSYYLVAGLTALGLSVFDAFKLALAVVPPLAAAGICCWLIEVLGHRGATRMALWAPTLTASASYAYAPYLLTDVYKRGALPEGLALALLPWMLFSFERLARRPCLRSLALAAITAALLVLAHNVASLLGLAVLGAYLALIAVARRLACTELTEQLYSVKSILCYSALAVCLGLGISGFYWLPLLVERSYAPSFFEALKSGFWSTGARIADGWPPVQTSLAFDYRYESLYRMGVVQLLVSIPGLALAAACALGTATEAIRRRASPPPNATQPSIPDLPVHPLVKPVAAPRVKVPNADARLMPMATLATAIILVGVFLVSPLSAPIWQGSPLLSSFQFPWRVQGAIALATACSAGFGSYWIARRRASWAAIAATLVIASVATASLYGLPTDFVPEPLLDAGEIHKWTGHGGWIRPRQLPLQGLSYEQAAAVKRLFGIEQRPGLVKLSLEASRPTVVASHILYFPGWKVFIDACEQPAFPITPSGLLGFDVPEGPHTIVARFEDTALRLAAETVSALAGLVLLLIIAASFQHRQPATAATIIVLALVAIFTAARLSAKPSPPVEFHSLDLPPSNGVRLLGAALDRPREGFLGVTLYWQALQPLRDLETYVALVDEQGNAVGNPMRKPLERAYLTSEWQVGEIVPDRAEIQLSADIDTSRLRLRAGLRPFHPTGISHPVASFRAHLSAPEPSSVTQPAQMHVADVLALEGCEPRPQVAAAGTDLPVALNWRALDRIPGDTGIYLHLVDARGRMWAQADGPPGPSAYPAALWEAGERVREIRRLRIPVDAPPGRYALRLGAYRYPDLEPLPVKQSGQTAVKEAAIVANVFVVAPQTRVADAHPTSTVGAKFGEQIELVGFDLSAGELRPGDALKLMTYWRAVRPITADYTIFAHLVDSTGSLRAQRDGPPADDGYPTSLWHSDEYVADVREIPIGSDLPPGDYRLLVGLYQWPSLDRLPVAANAPTIDNSVELAVIKVAPAQR